MERVPLKIGDLQEKFGSIERGWVHLIDLPLGIPVNLSVIIASGKTDGPTFLVTSNIHGDEVNPLIVVHRFLDNLNLDHLKGRIVIFPSLNPTGHLISSRYPLFEPGKDPNRCWPEYFPKKPEKPSEDPWYPFEKRTDEEPGPQERAFVNIAQLFKEIKPSFHVDLHTFSTLSIPFIFLDRIIYNVEEGANAEQVVEAAKGLLEKTNGFVNSIGLTILRERPPWLYVKSKLHRSTSGWTLNCLKIPSCTIELGSMNVAIPSARDGGLEALMNVLYWSKMLDGTPQPIKSCPVINFPKPHRYLLYPQADQTGIADYQLEVGQAFKKSDLLATIRSVDGRTLSKITAEMDGYVIAYLQGVAKYNKSSLAMVAVEDPDSPMLMDYKDCS